MIRGLWNFCDCNRAKEDWRRSRELLEMICAQIGKKFQKSPLAPL